MTEPNRTDDNRFSSLPKWPDEAKDLPDSTRPGPARARLSWVVCVGSFGLVMGLLSPKGQGLLGLLGGFIAYGLLGLLVEYCIYHQARREQERDRW